MLIFFFGLRWVSWGRDYTSRPHYCIQCGQSSRFQLRTRMRFIHCFWIPLIPVSGKHQVYRCRNCGTTYDRVEESTYAENHHSADNTRSR